MRFLITILTAILTVAFTFDLASALKRDAPNSGYDASGKGHSGRATPVPGTNPSTFGKKNKSN